jgi:hypothetical protein
MPSNPNETKTRVVSKNPEQTNQIATVEQQQTPKVETQKQPAWRNTWQNGVKNFRNVFRKENQNSQKPHPKSQNELVTEIEKTFKKDKNFNQLSAKEKGIILGIAVVTILALLASSAFLIPSGLTVAGYVGPYLGLSNAAVSVGGVTIPNLTTLIGTSGSFGTYGFLNGLGASSLATTTAGMYGVQATTAAIGTGLLVGGQKLANRGDKLSKKYMDRLSLRSKKVESKSTIKSPEIGAPIPQVSFIEPNKPSTQNVQVSSPKIQTQNSQIRVSENSFPDNVEINRGLNLSDLKARFNNIMSNNQLTQEQQDQAVNGMLNSALQRFKDGAKNVKTNEAIQICLSTNNYDMWKKFYQELGRQSGARVNLAQEMFDRIRGKK